MCVFTACALQFLHERNISHLDLKPQNILLSGCVLKLAGKLTPILSRAPKKQNKQITQRETIYRKLLSLYSLFLCCFTDCSVCTGFLKAIVLCTQFYFCISFFIVIFYVFAPESERTVISSVLYVQIHCTFDNK